LFKVKCSNVTEIKGLVEVIEDKYAPYYRRRWSLHDREIGIYLYEHLGTYSGSVFTIMTIVDFDMNTDTCDVDVRNVGGAMSLIGMSKAEDFVTRLINEITDYADRQGWTYEVERVKTRPAGSQCPNCKAAYKYPKENRREDGSVDCQNCGKPFTPE